MTIERLVVLMMCSVTATGACAHEPGSDDKVSASSTTTASSNMTATAPTAAGETASIVAPRVVSLNQSELERQSLAVATYLATDPSVCSLARPTASNGVATATVYFGCQSKQGPVVPAVPARIVNIRSGTDPMSGAIRALLAGPTAQESRRGYLSSFGAASASVPFRIARLSNGLVAIDFDRPILDAMAPRLDTTQNPRHLFVATMDAHQIVATLGQFSGVRRVAILAGGQPICRARGEC